jgi:tripartite-type tricarboxylate transporter receptor subunit TctC
MYASLTCSAQTYPDKPIRMIVPFTPAGATDMLARIVAEGLSNRLGQRVIVENRPGAGGNIGAQIAAQSRADGYTLLMAPSSIYAIAITLYKAPGYDLVKDFAPVSTLANVPHVLVAKPSLGVGSVNELIALARSRPGKLNLASQGTGTVSHLEGEMLQSVAGIKLVHVPYKGSAPALVDLLGGRVDVMFDSIAATLPQIRAGKLTALAVCSGHRTSALPDLPTMIESGLAGYKAESWLGIMVPAGTPVPIIERLHDALNTLLADARVRSALTERGLEPAGSTPAEFAARVQMETAMWAKVVKASALEPQ